MKKIFNKQEFNRFRDRDSGAVYEDIEFYKCKFDNCLVSVTSDPKLRATLRNVSMIDCSVDGDSCSIWSPVVDSCCIENLKITRDMHFAWGAVFRQTQLIGKIGALAFRRDCGFDNVEGAQQAFDKANFEFYKNVDWALDISQANFTEEPDWQFAIPPHLVIRDPKTQVIVTKQRLLEFGDAWEELDIESFGETGIIVGLGQMFASEQFGNDIVAELFVAPKGNKKKFKEYMEGIELLHELGLCEEEPLDQGPVQGIPSLGLMPS